jgi:hypothetical protein
MSSPPYEPNLQLLWGTIQRAVRDPELRARPGGVVQNVWESYKQSYVAAGGIPPPLGIQQVNPLVSLASAQVRAERELAASIATYKATGFDQAITAAHIARDIDWRPGAGEVVPAFYRVRFQSEISVEGESMSRYVTWSPELNLPASVSGLLSVLEESAAAAAEDYGEEWSGLGDFVSITAI